MSHHMGKSSTRVSEQSTSLEPGWCHKQTQGLGLGLRGRALA